MEAFFNKSVYQKTRTLNRYVPSVPLEMLRCHRQSILDNCAGVSPIRKANSSQKHVLYCQVRTSNQVNFPKACNCAQIRRHPMKVSFDSNSLWEDISIEEVRKVSESQSPCALKYGLLPLILPGNLRGTPQNAKGHRQCSAAHRKTQYTGCQSIDLTGPGIPRNTLSHVASCAKNDNLSPVYQMLTSVNPNRQPNSNFRKSHRRKKHPVSINTQFKPPVVINTTNRIRFLKKAAVAFGDECPNIDLIGREEWGAKPPKEVTCMEVPVNYVFIHHTAMGACDNLTSCKERVKEVQDLHMVTNGWWDIGYNFLVGEDGRVYEARGWNRTGAHTKYYNSVSVGVSVMGDFTYRTPNEAALDAVRNIIDCGVNNSFIDSNYKLFGHRDVRKTVCPGDAFYAHIKEWSHYSYDTPKLHLRNDSNMVSMYIASIQSLAIVFWWMI